MINGQTRGTEAENEGKKESVVASRKVSKAGREWVRERAAEEEYRHGQEKQEGEERSRGTSRGQTCRKEGRVNRNWQKIAGKRRKKAKPDQDSRDFSPHLHSVVTFGFEKKQPFFYNRHFIFFTRRPSSHSSVSILYVHLLFPPIHIATNPPLLTSSLSPAGPIFSQLWTFFRRLFEQQKKSVSPSSCFSVPSLALLCFALLPSLSSFTLPSFLPSPSPPFLLLPPAGYCCSLSLFLKDYLCSHSDKGFGKGSASTPSFRPGGPMHGRRVHEGGRVCTSVCACVSICISHVYPYMCACAR